MANDIINVGEYRIRKNDPFNWVIERKYITGEKAKNPGKIIWSIEGYYGSLEHMAGALLKKKFEGAPEAELTDLRSSIEAMVGEFRTIRQEITEALEAQ